MVSPSLAKPPRWGQKNIKLIPSINAIGWNEITTNFLRDLNGGQPMLLSSHFLVIIGLCCPTISLSFSLSFLYNSCMRDRMRWGGEKEEAKSFCSKPHKIHCALSGFSVCLLVCNLWVGNHSKVTICWSYQILRSNLFEYSCNLIWWWRVIMWVMLQFWWWYEYRTSIWHLIVKLWSE